MPSRIANRPSLCRRRQWQGLFLTLLVGIFATNLPNVHGWTFSAHSPLVARADTRRLHNAQQLQQRREWFSSSSSSFFLQTRHIRARKTSTLEWRRSFGCVALHEQFGNFDGPAKETNDSASSTPPPLSGFNTTTTATVMPLVDTPTGGAVNKETPVPAVSSSSSSSWLQEKILLGIEPSADILAIMTIYFVEGALGLAALAKSYLLKDELSLGPAELSALSGLFVLPWTIKPLYGFLSDGFPLFGFRRKSYLILAGVLGALSYGLLSWTDVWTTLPSSWEIGGTIAALMLSSACIAMSDVVADGIVVTKTRELSTENPAVAGSLQSLCWGAAATGGLLSAYFSGSLLETMSVRSVFGITAVLPLLVATIAIQMQETPANNVIRSASTSTDSTVATLDATTTFSSTEDSLENATDMSSSSSSSLPVVEGVKEQASALWEALRQPTIWRPALFIFLWQSTPTADGAFFFFLNDELGLGPEFLGRVRLVTSVATLAGVALYNQYFKRVAIRDILYWSTWASFPLGMIPVLLTTHINRDWGIPDQALIFGDDVALAVLGEIAFLPTLVLAAKLCPPGVEAVLFATLMSIFNGASTVGTELGAFLTKVMGITETNFDNLTLLIVICNITSLYPLAFIGWLDRIGDMSEEALETTEEIV